MQNKLTENLTAAMRGASHILDKRYALKDKKGHPMDGMYGTKNYFNPEDSMDIRNREKRSDSVGNLPLLFPSSVGEKMPWNDDTFRGNKLLKNIIRHIFPHIEKS